MLIEDYALVGDLRAAALVGRNGSVDWLCLPRFDSASCFSALLGDESHGRWLVAPVDEVLTTTRRYRPDTLVLETDFETAEGVARSPTSCRPGATDRLDSCGSSRVSAAGSRCAWSWCSGRTMVHHALDRAGSRRRHVLPPGPMPSA
jgi:hypothetical protein